MLKKLTEFISGKIYRKPDEIQKNLLFSILTKNKDTEYGKDHSFSDIKTINDFQNQVPEVKYEDMTDYIEKIKSWIQNVLTADPVVYFATTSGTTNKSKFIPFTEQKYKDLMYEQLLRMLSAIKYKPSLIIDIIKWKILLFSWPKTDGKTQYGNIPYGSMSGWIANRHKKSLWKKIAVSEKILESTSFDEKMKILLDEAVPKDVRQIAFAYPIEITLFLKHVAERKWMETMKLRDIWKNIAFIGCMKSSLKEYKLDQYIDSKIMVMDAGIRASEWSISIGTNPEKRDWIPAIQHTFLEFKKKDCDEKPILVHELQEWQEYEVVMTTPYWLYRYNIGDVIRVTGKKKNIPLIEFVGRSNTLDMVGEHSPYHQIEKSINEAKNNTNISLTNYTVVPNFTEGEMPYYDIFIETEENDESKLKNFLQNIDIQLQNNIESYARMRGQNWFYRLEIPKLHILSRDTYDAINQNRVVNEAQPKTKHIIDGPDGIIFKKSLHIEKTIII